MASLASPDYYGELWSAISEQARLLEARRLLECVQAVPSTVRDLPMMCLKLVDAILDANQMEVSRRHMLYEKHLKGNYILDSPPVTPYRSVR